MELEKNKKRQKRRAMEAKALQKKQFRQQVINNKKKREGLSVEREVSEAIHERTELHSIQEQVHAPGSGDVEGPVRDVGD